MGRRRQSRRPTGTLRPGLPHPSGTGDRSSSRRRRCSSTLTTAHRHRSCFSQLFTRATDATGLPRVRFHDLRHTPASLLVAAGVPIKVVSERLGHAHPVFTHAHLPRPAARHGRAQTTGLQPQRPHRMPQRRPCGSGPFQPPSPISRPPGTSRRSRASKNNRIHWPWPIISSRPSPRAVGSTDTSTKRTDYRS